MQKLSIVKATWWVLPIALLSGGAYLFGRHLTIGRMARAEVSVRPFVLDLAQVDYKDDPSGKPVLNHLELRRRDGSEALVAYDPRDRSRVIGRRVNGMDGRVAGIFDSVSAVTSGWIAPKELAFKKRALAEPPIECVWPGEKGMGEDTILGYRAWKTLREATGAKRRVIAWRLPDFACKTVRTMNEERQSDGAWRRSFEAYPLSFAEADPDPAVFTNWEDYAELPPSAIRQRLYEKGGVTPEKCPSCFQGAAALDSGYFKAQTKP